MIRYTPRLRLKKKVKNKAPAKKGGLQPTPPAKKGGFQPVKQRDRSGGDILMVEVVIKGLIGLVLLAVCVFLIIWVFGILGIAIPDTIIKLLYVIAVLIGLLWIYRTAKAANLF